MSVSLKSKPKVFSTDIGVLKILGRDVLPETFLPYLFGPISANYRAVSFGTRSDTLPQVEKVDLIESSRPPSHCSFRITKKNPTETHR